MLIPIWLKLIFSDIVGKATTFITDVPLYKFHGTSAAYDFDVHVQHKAKKLKLAKINNYYSFVTSQ